MKIQFHEAILRNADGAAGAGADAGAGGAAGGGAGGAEGAGGAGAQPASRPEIIPETYWDAEKGAPKLDALMGDFSAAQVKARQFDERAAQVPTDASGYKLELSKDFKKPDGFGDFAIPPESTLGQKFPAIAHKYGLPQAAINEMVDAYAQDLIDQAGAASAAQAEDLKTLGERGKERITSVENFLRATLTKDEYAGLAGAVTSAAGVTALEKIIARVRGGVGEVPGGGTPAGGQVDMTGWSPERKLAYANEQAAQKAAARK